MNKFSIELANGISYAKPYINKFSDGFDTIEFVLDNNDSFSECTFAVVYSFCGKTGMSIQEGGSLEKTVDDESNKIMLTWSLGTSISCDSGVVIYQVVAYTSDDDGAASAIWYSPQGRITVGESVDTTEYETMHIGAEPSLVQQLMAAINNTQNNIADVSTRCDENAKSILASETEIAELSDSVVTINSDIGILSEKTKTNADAIWSNASGIAQLSGRVDTNAAAISSNASDIVQLSGRVDTNAAGIATNSSDIAQLSGKIDTNADSIMANTVSISQLSTKVDEGNLELKTDIGNIKNDISGINDEMEQITTDINLSVASVSQKTQQNSEGIAQNKSDIADVDSRLIECAATGEGISLTDGSNSKLRGLKIFGKTTQAESPTPESPQTLNSIGDGGSTDINICGKNFVNWESDINVSVSGLTLSGQKGCSSLVINGTSTAVNYQTITPGTKMLPAGTYTASVNGLNVIDNQFDRYYIVDVDKDEVMVNLIMSNSPQTFTLTKATPIRISFVFQQNSVYNNKTINIQIERGSSATQYEPYVKHQSIALETPNGLSGIMLPASAGAAYANYIDSNGKRWVCDEVDFARGVYIKRVQRTQVTIGQCVTLSSGHMGGVFTTPDKARLAAVGALFEKTKYLIAGGASQFATGLVYENISNFVLIGTETDTLDTLKSKYDGSEAVYVLAEPVEIPLTDEQIAAYKALHTNMPTTNIYNIDGANIEVGYAADTKNYINNKYESRIAALESAIISLGGNV